MGLPERIGPSIVTSLHAYKIALQAVSFRLVESPRQL